MARSNLERPLRFPAIRSRAAQSLGLLFWPAAARRNCIPAGGQRRNISWAAERAQEIPRGIAAAGATLHVSPQLVSCPFQSAPESACRKTMDSEEQGWFSPGQVQGEGGPQSVQVQPSFTQTQFNEMFRVAMEQAGFNKGQK